MTVHAMYIHDNTHLTVHAISHAAMPRYAVPKVLDLEPAFEATGKETSKWSNDGGKSCQDHSVKLHTQIASPETAQRVQLICCFNSKG